MSEKVTEIKPYTVGELQGILTKHKMWLDSEEEGVRADLCGANLRGAALVSANLASANLYGADLCGAALVSANLASANLASANLYDANLHDADLRGADLCGADLRDADLCSANLRDAALGGANLRGANLRGAKYEENTLRGVVQIGPIGSRKSYLVVFGIGADGYVFRAGCFAGSADELSARAKSVHGDSKHATDYLAAIEFAKIMLPPSHGGHLEVAQ